MRARLSLLLAVVLILLGVGSVVGHDMFIMPDKFRVSSGETVRIGFHSADGFPESSALPKRLRDAALQAGTAPLAISLKEDGKRMTGEVTAPAAGHFSVTVTNSAATETMRAASFLKYLEEEGLSQIVESRRQRGEADKAARERYTMFAKTLLLAGAPGEGYKRAVGLPIEIVPEKDPYALKAGESLPVQVLFKGAPAAGLEMMAASIASPKNQSIGKTDAQGRITVPMKSGIWRLHTIYMERPSDADADWESFWATLTFEVP